MQQGAGAGRTSEVVSTAGDWPCEVMIRQWANICGEQKTKQLELTDAEDASLELGKSRESTGAYYTAILGRARPKVDVTITGDSDAELLKT